MIQSVFYVRKQTQPHYPYDRTQGVVYESPGSESGPKKTTLELTRPLMTHCTCGDSTLYREVEDRVSSRDPMIIVEIREDVVNPSTEKSRPWTILYTRVDSVVLSVYSEVECRLELLAS